MAESCRLVNDTVSGSVFNKLCGSGPTTLYQSVLDTPPDGTFSALLSPTDCTVTLTFHQCGGREMERSFTPGQGELIILLTVPDVKSITATCSGGEELSKCTIFWSFDFHYCHCCEG